MMHIDTVRLTAAIQRACAELDRLDAAAAEGEIGRLDGRRLILRIEPVGEDRTGRKIPLPPGAERIVGEGDAERDADAAEIAAAMAELEGDPESAARFRADAAGIRSEFNACCYRDACRALLQALQLILENPDHELLPTERETAEAAIRKAMPEAHAAADDESPVPWADCRVAFDADADARALRLAAGWPRGWEFDEVDETSGRRVAVFLVRGLPTLGDAARVVARLAAIAKATGEG